VLVFGRAVTGLGAGGLVVGMHTIVGQVVRLEDRSMHYSSLGACFTLASFGGPLVGGAFTDKLSWRWCFWVRLSSLVLNYVADWRTDQSSVWRNRKSISGSHLIPSLVLKTAG
jgi:MFS family permease